MSVMRNLPAFIAALREGGLDCEAWELADALWLARHITPPVAMRESIPPPPEEQKLAAPKTKSPESPSFEKPSSDQATSPIQSVETTVSAHIRSPAPGQTPAKPLGTRPFRAPTPWLITHALALGRALRPLLRRVAARNRFLVDEAATVHLFAELEVSLPVLRGAPERWLELALVVDHHPSFVLWEPLLNELRRLLERHGAFRDLRLWRLGQDAAGKACIWPGLHGGTARQPKFLGDPEGRRVILLFSDFTAPAWWQGDYWETLRNWSQRQPVALLHLLPERLWRRTGLAVGDFVDLGGAGQAGPVNAKLRIHPEQLPPEREVIQRWRGGLKLPILSLNPTALQAWSRLLAGRSETWTAGVVFPAGWTPPASADEPEPQPPDARLRLRRFRAGASPQAWDLARYCAAMPLTLPVARLVQETMLPDSLPTHLAEVFLGGLLEKAEHQLMEQPAPLEIIYEFHDGVRQLLIDSLTPPQLLDVLQRVSRQVEERLGRPHDFLARLADPTVFDPDSLLAPDSRPFAQIKLQVLRRLGGEYGAWAMQLVKLLPGNQISPSDVKKIAFSFDKSLLIAVFVPTTNERGEDFKGEIGERATGYPVGKDLILTARNVLHPEPPNRRDPRYPVAIRWHYFRSGDGADWIDISDDDIVWESQGELDAALIRCRRPPDAVGWGIVSHERPHDGTHWIGEGFPRAAKYDNRRNPSSFIGTVYSKAPNEPYFELTVDAAPEDEEGWKGASGMPVFVDGKILGVVRSVPPNFSAKKLYATPTWKLLEDDAFRRCIGSDEQMTHVKKVRGKLVKMLQSSPEAVLALSEEEQLMVSNSMVGLDDGQRADWLVGRLLNTDMRTVIQALRAAHRSLCEEFNNQSGNQSGERSEKAAAILVDIAQLVIPALYDHDVIKWVKEQRDSRNIALVPLPASTRMVAEIIMAGADGRATRFLHREDEDDQPEGELNLPRMPEGGIDAGNVEVRVALLRHLNKKFNLGESDVFRRAVDDYLLATFPRRARGGLKRSLEERIKLTAALLESKRRDSGQTFYMIFDLPKDAEGQNAMRAMVASLKRDYSALVFLCLDDSSDREREEVKLFDPFCRMLPLKKDGKVPSPQSALQLWREKLAILETEFAKAADSAQKFKIQQDIDEAKAKIRELRGSA